MLLGSLWSWFGWAVTQPLGLILVAGIVNFAVIIGAAMHVSYNQRKATEKAAATAARIEQKVDGTASEMRARYAALQADKSSLIADKSGLAATIAALTETLRAERAERQATSDALAAKAISKTESG